MKTHTYFELDGFEAITTPTIYAAIRYHIIDVRLEDTRRMKYKQEYKYHKVILLNLKLNIVLIIDQKK